MKDEIRFAATYDEHLPRNDNKSIIWLMNESDDPGRLTKRCPREPLVSILGTSGQPTQVSGVTSLDAFLLSLRTCLTPLLQNSAAQRKPVAV